MSSSKLDGKGGKGAGNSLQAESTGEKRRRGRPTKAESEKKIDQSTMDDFVRKSKEKEELEAFARKEIITRSPQPVKTGERPGEQRGEGAASNDSLSKEQQTDRRVDPLTNDGEDVLSDREEDTVKTATEVKETETGKDSRNKYEERNRERVIEENILEKIGVDLAKWKEEIESEIRVKVKTEIDELKE